MPLQDANPTPSFGGFGLKAVERGVRTIRSAGNLAGVSYAEALMP